MNFYLTFFKIIARLTLGLKVTLIPIILIILFYICFKVLYLIGVPKENKKEYQKVGYSSKYNKKVHFNYFLKFILYLKKWCCRGGSRAFLEGAGAETGAIKRDLSKRLPGAGAGSFQREPEPEPVKTPRNGSQAPGARTCQREPEQEPVKEPGLFQMEPEP